jgi:hypothetical protein
MKDIGIQAATLSPAQYNVLIGYAEKAHAGVISLDVSWSSYEPSRPAPAGEWTSLDAFVNDVRSHGMEVRFQLVQIPQWARSAGSPSFASQPWYAPSTGAELAAWSAWVERLVGHFGTRVKYYEIWNEENGSTFWSQGANPTEYARLLEASYVATMAKDPSAWVMFGGLDRNDVGFLSAVYKAESSLYPAATLKKDFHFFDILGDHPYSGNRSPATALSQWVYRDEWGTMDENFTGFELLRSVMVQNGDGWKHVYIGEYGFSTAPWNSFPGVPDAVRASYLSVAYRLAAATGYVDGLCWYYFYTTPWNPSSWSLLLGSGSSYQMTDTFKALEAIPG